MLPIRILICFTYYKLKYKLCLITGQCTFSLFYGNCQVHGFPSLTSYCVGAPEDQGGGVRPEKIRTAGLSLLG